MLLQVQKYYRTAFVVLFVLVFIIAFQTYQQLFYIERFQLAEGVEFFDVLKNQFYRWVIWFVIAFLLPVFVSRDQYKKIDIRLLLKHFTIIISLVLFNVFIISALQSYTVEELTVKEFFSEYFTFFLFQKAPMYTLGYMAFTVVLFFYLKNEQLQITVEELIDIKDQHQKEYELLKSSNVDHDQILSVKIGKKLKVIPISEIYWIEADDYCVEIHANGSPSYRMRSSLKSLEGKLPSHFLRVHRKGIVNMKKVKEFKNSNQSELILENEDMVPVSKVNAKAVKLFLQQRT